VAWLERRMTGFFSDFFLWKTHARRGPDLQYSFVKLQIYSCTAGVKASYSAWEQRVDQYDAMLGFFMMPVFRIQARNPFISCMVILVQLFSGVGTLPTLLIIACCAYLLDSLIKRVWIKPVKKKWK
jgi:hypothetical protein